MDPLPLPTDAELATDSARARFARRTFALLAAAGTPEHAIRLAGHVIMNRKPASVRAHLLKLTAPLHDNQTP